MKTLTAKELALYLGCEVQYEYETRSEYPDLKHELRNGVLAGLTHSEVDITTEWGVIRRMITQVKPILRPLSDMTGAEAKELAECSRSPYYRFEVGLMNKILLYPQPVVYLLSKHFDLFGWIESGLAIDKSTLISPISK